MLREYDRRHLGYLLIRYEIVDWVRLEHQRNEYNLNPGLEWEDEFTGREKGKIKNPNGFPSQSFQNILKYWVVGKHTIKRKLSSYIFGKHHKLLKKELELNT
uniref:Uncharacterized protein n=1 Tax=Glossina austeni TaxID=7395 RepID=A0A1A9VBN3_GLOAU